MSSMTGENIRLSIFGESHSQAIGMTLDGIPPGIFVDQEKLQAFLNRRAPGNNALTTARKEEDRPVFLCGLKDNYTCGTPLTAIIQNTDIRSADYSDLRQKPRPGHADYTGELRYHGFQDPSGGGHFSGRLTAPLCLAGGILLQELERMGISVFARIAAVGGIMDPSEFEAPVSRKPFPVVDDTIGERMQQMIQDAKADGDSVGGIVECVVYGFPAGFGDPMFGGIESRIASIVFGIPAVKGLEFGSGFTAAALHGSQNNDAFIVENGTIQTATNRCGGILGGISTGMPIVFRAAFKPTPSIAREQRTVDLSSMTNDTITIKGRHDPCIAIRAVPVVEAAAAIALFDLIMGKNNTVC